MKKKILIAGVFGLVIIGYFSWKSYTSKGSAVQYITQAVTKGTLIASISSSGQVSVSNQVDIKPKNSGNIVRVNVQEGQEVKSGMVLVQIDATSAEQTVRNATLDLASAKLSLEKLKQPADQLSLVQSENALSQANETKQNAQDTLKKAYDDGFTAVSNAFLNLPTVVTGTHDILYGNNLSNNQNNMDYYANAVQSYDDKIYKLRDSAAEKYQTAKGKYDKNFVDYKTVSRSSDILVIENLVKETYNTTQAVSEAIKSATNFIQDYEDILSGRNLKPVATADTQITSLNSYTSSMNTALANLLNIENTIKDSRDAISSADRTITEKTESLSKLKSGANPLDIQTQELSVKQRENALLDAKLKLADYFVTAPFDGVIAKVNSKVGDQASAGSAVATIITKQKLAEVSLNEVDVAKVAVGQKVTLKFDAVPDLNISGEVMNIDTLGTITQGVVTYMVKIGFDTQDVRVKSGMSVNAAIITNVKQDTIIVPSVAIKEQGGSSYVEILPSGATTPIKQNVKVGISNDTQTEILDGLKEGDAVVIQTITATSVLTQSQSSGLRIPGLQGGGGGGALRGVGGFGR